MRVRQSTCIGKRPYSVQKLRVKSLEEGSVEKRLTLPSRRPEFKLLATMLKKKRGVVDFAVILLESKLTWEEGTSAENYPD